VNLRLFVTVRGVTEEMEPFNRHVPFWLHHFYQTAGPSGELAPGPFEGGITVVTQPDCEAKTAFPTVSLGVSGKAGKDSIDRLTRQFRAVLQMHPEADWFLYHEYDSFCLVPDFLKLLWPPAGLWHAAGVWPPAGLWANVMPNTFEHFTAKEYLNLPMLLNRVSMELLCDKFDCLAFDQEDGVFDRWASRLILQERIPYRPFGPLGFTTDIVCEQNALNCALRLINGAAFIHGVKDIYGFNIVNKYSRANNQNKGCNYANSNEPRHD